MPEAMRDAELAAILRAPFAEQVAFFRQKLGDLVPTAKWDDLWHEQHDRAFMVAGAAKADLLADLAAAVDKAIADGETLQAFRKRFGEIVTRHGWAGWTGDDRTTDRPQGGKGVAWRTRVIYETNLITSYSAGRLAQLKDGGYEWWIYKHSDFVRRPRPHHVALDGVTRRADDPFWQTYYPPNGWGCFPGDVELRANARLGYRFFYRGEIVELHTRSGRKLSVTPNHPILTGRGWVAAGEIEAGDELLGACANVDTGLRGIVDDEQAPAMAENLFEALASQGLRIAPMTANDFDGDAAGGENEVEIAGSDAALMDELQPVVHEQIGKVRLDGALVLPTESAYLAFGAAGGAFVEPDTVLAQDAADGRLGNAQPSGDCCLTDEPRPIHRDDLALEVVIDGISRFPCAAHEALAPVAAGTLFDPTGAHAVGAVADGDAAQAQDALQGGAADTKLFGQLLEAYPGLITVDEVVFVGKRDWSGHVYDFTTDNGLIVAGGLIVSNCRCRVIGARGPRDFARYGGDPDRRLPDWVGQIDPKTDAPVGVDKGFAYQPGATVADTVRALAKKLDALPREVSIDAIQSWVKASVFAHWMAAPEGAFPLVRLPDADAVALGAKDGVRVAHLSAETALKQLSAHPEIAPAEYAMVQTVVDAPTYKVVDGKSVIYIREVDEGGGYVLVVKATQTGEGLWVTSYRRLSRSEAVKDSEVRRLINKGNK